MNQHEFETAVLRMWTTTRIPLTRVNLQVYTSTPRNRIERWMEELAVAGIVELDSDDDGEALWKVRGAARSTSGPRSIDEWERLAKLLREVDDAPSKRSAMVAMRAPSRVVEPEDPPRDEKSLLASGVLSFVFGPFGWLYAAPVKDAVAGIFVFALLVKLLPAVVVGSLMGIVSPLSAIAGLVYAHRYNTSGRRRSMLELARGEDTLRLPRPR